ncbi:THAP domain-containing protein 2 [Anabarilius grahami]|uniref:THAP domain-containing protein 2 n=1 Tax=Anabarilius grahami TaxID=495550 RepID=A0A3N0XVH4_ANAGA|nr:THAP domain-containing protein 2 [Anabarilius grahami]
MASRKFKYQRREDSSSTDHCCVPLCVASSKFNSVLSFHTFPVDEETRRKWIHSIRREQFNITSHTRVCSRHFISDDLIEPSTPKGRRLLRKGAVPTLFQWNGYSVAEPRHTGVWQRREDYTPVDEDPVPMDAQHLELDYCSVPEPAAVDNALNQTEDLHKEVERLRRRVEELSGQSLQPIDEFFLFMVHLSVGLTQRDLAHRFNIHQSTVSRIITTWANFLYTVLGSVRIWMSEEEVKAHLPNEFQDYPDTQVVIDCTELRCQTPSSLLLQSEVFSTYKSHCTFKGLIGMAPHGAAPDVDEQAETKCGTDRA